MMKRLRDAFPRSVWLLAFASFFNDAASDMLIPFMPAFLATFGAGALWLGRLEGVAEAVSAWLRLLAGRSSDRTGKRKPLVLAGYAVSVLTRPLYALAGSPLAAVALRAVDRLGKGARTAPRDALLAGHLPPGRLGAGFGFHRAMDHAGAILGPLLGLALYLALPGTEEHRLRWIFVLTVIPGLAAWFVLWGVQEAPSAPRPEPPAAPANAPAADASGPQGWGRLPVFLGLYSLWTLTQGSDLFLILYLTGEKTPLARVILLYALLHAIRAAVTLPGGALSDRLGRKPLLLLGWTTYGLLYLGMGFVPTLAPLWFLLYGLYAGMVEGGERALVSELAPAHKRGAAFGWFHGLTGLFILPANLLLGHFWDSAGAARCLTVVGALALCCAFLLALLPLPRRAA